MIHPWNLLRSAPPAESPARAQSQRAVSRRVARRKRSHVRAPKNRSPASGIRMTPEAKKIGPQLQYAEKRGFKLALIAGPDEIAQGVWKIKDLAKREESTTPTAEVAAKLQSMLSQ